MKTAIVTTTINVPEFLDGYCRDFLKHGRRDVGFVVIGDKKTPPEAQAYCENLGQLHGFRMEYFTVERQQEYLKAFPELDEYLPYNSVQRRNVGMLYAYEQGCKILIAVDDDNYVLEPDLLKAHLQVGNVGKLKSYSSSTDWMNPCEFLESNPPFSFFHRGFPMSKRRVSAELTEGQRTGRVVVNVGMWLGDPDVDAWVRMTVPIESTRWTATENFALAPATWAPFNSQQTAVARDLVPAYFLNPNAGRYDDIWGSFILHRIANHLGDLISYGSPIVSHLQQRSLTSLWRDMDDERMGTLLTDEFTSILQGCSLHADTYEGCYREIADAIEKSFPSSRFSPAKQAYLREYARGMRVWLGTFARLSSRLSPRMVLEHIL
jgi:hypothetical protein